MLNRCFHLKRHFRIYVSVYFDHELTFVQKYVEIEREKKLEFISIMNNTRDLSEKSLRFVVEVEKNWTSDKYLTEVSRIDLFLVHVGRTFMTTFDNVHFERTNKSTRYESPVFNIAHFETTQNACFLDKVSLFKSFGLVLL